MYTTLDPYNVTVVGGRVMDVGVGGLTLGSGLSYLSDLYGLACDNVVTYEVCTITHAIKRSLREYIADGFGQWGCCRGQL